MIISVIAAMSDGRVIGSKGRLPWHIPIDLAHFRSLTIGHTVVMGRKTYESIGHPLEGRRNIVVTRGKVNYEGCETAHSLREVLELVSGDEELFVCGGTELFREALPISQRIYLTLVHGKYPGDTYFPEIPDGFVEVQREERSNTTPPLTFLVFEKSEQIDVEASPEELYRKGKQALQRKLYFLARHCFEQAIGQQDSPDLSSHLAFSLVKSGGDQAHALRLAEKAVAAEPNNPIFLLNLGRVQILAGNKAVGLETLRKGAQIGGGPDFYNELNKWGVRRPPIFRSLPRSHPCNKYLGMLLFRLGIR